MKKVAKESAPRDVKAVIAALSGLANSATLDGMSRYGIPSHNALGVPINAIQRLAKQIGHDHALAGKLWESGVYEARLLAAYVDDPAAVSKAQMDRWCRGFDSWAVVDTVCFVLFDRSPHAVGRIEPWSRLKGEFQKRAAFVLLACVAHHNKTVSDQELAKFLPLMERASTDDRNFVKKGVLWAIRALATRQSLQAGVLRLAGRLAAAENSTQRWIGKTAVREINKRAGRNRS